MKRNQISLHWITAAIVALLVLCGGAIAHAALQTAGPVSPATGFPEFYRDLTGRSLSLCLDQNGFCVLPAEFDPAKTPAAPAITTTATSISAANFPVTSEYWQAASNIDIGAVKFVLTLSLEAGFAAPGPVRPVPANGQQITTLFIKLKAMKGLTPGTYTVLHPFGQFTFTADAAGNVPALTLTDGGGVGAFTALLPATNTLIGPYLVWDAGIPIIDPVTGNMYIGDPRVDHAVIGGKNNFVKITGPNVAIQSNLFRVAGKLIAMSPAPATLTFPLQNGLVPSAPQTVTVTNVTGAALTPGAVTSTNPNFTIPVNGCTGVSIPSSGTCAFQVVFQGTPPDGVKTAAISVAAPVNNPAAVVTVSGVLDATAPVVLSSVPANNATVASNSAISVTFSEAVTNVTDATFTLVDNNNSPVAGAVAFNAASNTATFTPAPLAQGAHFTATIIGGAGGVTDLVGNPLAANFTLSFTTTTPDSTPPTVLTIDPADKASDVSPTKAITVTFSEAMDPATLNFSTFTLSGGITGAVAYNPATNTATFTPSAPLANGALITVSITTGVKDLAGNPLTAAFSAQFSTDAGPSVPTLVSPANNATITGTTVDFQWSKSTDPDGDAINYQLFVCTNEAMIGCNPVVVAASAPLNRNLAGLGGSGATGLLFAGLVFAGVRGRKRVMFFIIAGTLVAGTLVSSCGKSGTTPATTQNLVTKQVTGLTAGTTYFWKVVADDGRGATKESETRTFTTQ